jgi:hypothetical protein
MLSSGKIPFPIPCEQAIQENLFSPLEFRSLSLQPSRQRDFEAKKATWEASATRRATIKPAPHCKDALSAGTFDQTAFSTARSASITVYGVSSLPGAASNSGSKKPAPKQRRLGILAAIPNAVSGGGEGVLLQKV